MIEHIVLFKFNEETTKDQKDEALVRLKSLQQSLPGILDFQGGYDFSGRSNGYEMAITVRFKDQSSLENYGPSDEHQAVIHYLKEIGMLETLAFDFNC